MIILKVTKDQGFTLSLQKLRGGGQIDLLRIPASPSAFLGLK